MYEQDPGWQFLKQTPEKLAQDQGKIIYDAKTTCWVPDSEEGFVWAQIQSEADGKVTVKLANGEERTLKKDETQEMNPPKFLKSEDMSNLTFLNEASVLFNLRARYTDMLIYTYSGLFCVVINPYKRLPIYTESVAQMFMGRRKNEMPPHLFAAADEAYRNMLQDSHNQSMLITGESGAGKTENTKKVISYFATVGASQVASGPSTPGEKKPPTLEEQIVQTNPVLEAFGNAKTVRNNNSSRFGKFIRTHFNPNGKLAGADIEHYLLEKSRVIKQAPGERCYHIFYQIHSEGVKGLRAKLLLGDDISEYQSVAQAELTIAGVNDQEEMELTDEAFDIMNYSQAEKDNIYRLTAGLMHMYNMKFKTKPREEQAEPDGTEDAGKCCQMYGIDPDLFLTAMTKPRVKVGAEWVAKGQNVEQVHWGKGAMSKGLYSRLFDWLVKRCNKTLSVGNLEKRNYIGVLDIAGFEIFDFNSFEQLWINFVNEKLQQFFNHHMFVLEQEEYKREGIEWEFIDFGLDLAACIELIEKPMGLIAMMDEECIVPKATDLTLAQKIIDTHLGKHPNLQKPKPPKGKQSEAHFALAHYAGIVRYNVTAWLEKNKDPLNDSAVAALKTSKDNPLLLEIWSSYQTQEEQAKASKKEAGGGKKKGKSGSMMTVSMLYRESLNNLMSMLKSTHPHFIRCLIPNEFKKSGVLDATLVMHQLTCNGVLEGIRICRKGFPNRMMYEDFCQRYAILAPDEAATAKVDPNKSGADITKKLVSQEKLGEPEFRLGNTKVFFKAGILAKMEELREEELAIALSRLQCLIRWYIAQCDYKRKKDQQDAFGTIQSNIKAWCVVRTWPWFLLMGQIKPLIEKMKREEEEARKKGAASEEMEARLKNLEEDLDKEQKRRQQSELEAIKLSQEKAALQKDLDKESELRKEFEKKAMELEREVESLRDQVERLEKNKRDLESQIATLKGNISNLEATVKSQQLEKEQQQRQITTLQDEIVHLDQQIAKLTHDRKVQEETNKELSESFNLETQKTERLEGIRHRLEDQLSEKTDDLEREKRLRSEAERNRKRLEGESRLLHETLEQFKQQCHDLEQNVRRREMEMGGLRLRCDEADSQGQKLHGNVRQLMSRIEQLEEELEQEKRARTRSEKLRTELQEENDRMHQSLEESNGRLHAAQLWNNQRKEEMSRIYHEIDERNIQHENRFSEMFNSQWSTISRLRDISLKMAALEHDATQISQFVVTMNASSADRLPKSASQPYLSRSFSARRFGPPSPNITTIDYQAETPEPATQTAIAT